ncbi:MAG: hypothetical protein IV092_00545 [Burkholderiaceae bacterium]|nr:hypothetical protein [Burkholderiaceae bacterium]
MRVNRASPARDQEMNALVPAVNNEPLVTFYRLISSARIPIRADRSALGTLPASAHQHCEAVASASALGWYAFSPLDFTVQWDGSEVIWTFAGEDNWFPLETAQYPGFSDSFDECAPAHLRGFAPPFLSATSQPGLLQVWTGLFVRTAPDWNLLIRPVVNYPPSRNYDLFEGIIETDRWFGPLFTNLRLARRDHPIHFGTEMPLFQLQAIPRGACSAAAQASTAGVEGLVSLSEADWSDYESTIVKPNLDPHRQVGAYASRTRKRRHS